MSNRLMVAGLAVVLLLGSVAAALEFSADVVTKAQGQTMNSKMNFAGDKWRVETTAAGRKTISIVRGDKKVVWMIMPEQRLYMEQKMQPEQQRGMTAKQAGEVSRKKLGREKINGIDCDKYEVIYQSGKKTEKMHQWVSNDKWPVKSAAVDGSWSTEFKNLKKGKQPDSLFVMPAGYNKMGLPAMRMPGGMKVSPLLKDMKELPDQE